MVGATVGQSEYKRVYLKVVRLERQMVVEMGNAVAARKVFE